MMSVTVCKKCECHPPRGINTKIPPEGDTIHFDQLILIRSYRLQTRLPIKCYNLKSLMPTTRKEMKARKSRGLEMFSDLENLDIVSGSRQSTINRLSSEINSRISRGMDEMMNSVSVQIERAINDAFSSQVLPQIQNALTAGSGHMTQKGWNVPAEGPEIEPEVLRSEYSRNNLKNELVRNRLNDEPMDSGYDTIV